MATAIKDLWRRTRISSRRVIIGVANQRVVVRLVDLPWMRPSELRSSLAFQAGDYLPIPVDQTELDYAVISEHEAPGGQRLLRVLLGSLGPVAGFEEGAEALVDVGARVTNLDVHDNGVLRFVRILLMGGGDVDPEAGDLVAQRLEVFVEEVRGSLDFYRSQQDATPLGRVVVSGGGSLLGPLVERLQAVTGAPTTATSRCSEYWWQGRSTSHCVRISFVTGDTINGPLHTNDTISVNGNPRFDGEASTADTGAMSRRPVTGFTWRRYGLSSCTDRPLFQPGDPEVVPILPLPTTNTTIKAETDRAAGRTGCLCNGPTRIVLNSSGTMTVTRRRPAPAPEPAQLPDLGRCDRLRLPRRRRAAVRHPARAADDRGRDQQPHRPAGLGQPFR